MKRTDIDIEGVWTITSEAREKGNAGVLKLPQMALDIIQAQRRIAGNNFILAGRNGKPIEVDWRKEKLDAELNFAQPWTIHDLRRTARSLMSRVGVSSEVAEQVLGHTIGGVEGIYNRHTYTEEKAEAVSKLATLIERILNPSDNNVVPLRAAAS